MSVQEQVAAGPGVSVRGSGWFIRRAVIGLIILTVTIAGSAALLYASIDQTQDQARQTTEAQEQE